MKGDERMKKLFVLLVAVSLIFPLAQVSAEENSSAVKEVTIIHDTHFHGNFGKSDEAENIVNYLSLVSQIRDEKPNSLFVGSGDDLASSVESSLFMGEHMVDAFNAGKLDADTYGNHDFDLGPEQLTSLVEKSQFPWVSANLIDKRTNDVFAAEKGAKQFIVKEVNGVNVGITGLINEEAPDITNLGENAVVLNPVEAMKTIIPEMENAGADIIVVLSHLAGPVAENVAEQVDGIDVIVGDHAGNIYDEPKMVNNTIVSFVGDEFQFLGELTLNIKDNEIVDYTFLKHDLESESGSITPDPTIKEVIDSYWAQLDSEFEKVVGKTEVELDVRKSTIRKEEAVIGNYLADTLRDWAEADVALVNSGGIRSDKVYEAGFLTKGDIMAILPFTNYGVKLELTGEQIRAALENGLSKIEEGAGRFPQVSGMSFGFDPSQPAGSRIVEVKVAGQQLDATKTYTLATLDFVADGGDGYEVFTEATQLIDKNGGPLFSTLIAKTLEEQGSIHPVLDGRISVTKSTEEVTEEATEETTDEVTEEAAEESTEETADEAADDTDKSDTENTAYIIKSGDSLWKIAKEQLGDPLRWKEIYSLNKDTISDPDLIYPGQELVLPE